MQSMLVQKLRTDTDNGAYIISLMVHVAMWSINKEFYKNGEKNKRDFFHFMGIITCGSWKQDTSVYTHVACLGKCNNHNQSP